MEIDAHIATGPLRAASPTDAQVNSSSETSETSWRDSWRDIDAALRQAILNAGENRR